MKPENFLMGQPETPNTKKLYLVDLGLGGSLNGCLLKVSVSSQLCAASLCLKVAIKSPK